MIDGVDSTIINDPAALQLEIDRLCRNLDAAGRELGARIDELATAELAYGDAFEDGLTQLVEDYADRRLPGEDVRRATIHRDPVVREKHHAMRRLERRIEAVEKWARKVENELNGRQSQLRSLESEERGLRSLGGRRAA